MPGDDYFQAVEVLYGVLPRERAIAKTMADLKCSREYAQALLDREREVTKLRKQVSALAEEHGARITRLENGEA